MPNMKSLSLTVQKTDRTKTTYPRIPFQGHKKGYTIVNLTRLLKNWYILKRINKMDLIFNTIWFNR